MTYENYTELYEAIYFVDRLNGFADNGLPQRFGRQKADQLGIHESVYTAALRILAANGLLHCDGMDFVLTKDGRQTCRHVLDSIIGENNAHYTGMFETATRKGQFLFSGMNDAEYELHARYNFGVTHKMGSEIAKHLPLTGKTVLELGGSSGGLATALLENSTDCRYTIVDTKIPCRVGEEFRQTTGQSITFTEGDVFALNLPPGPVDYILLMNLLHDFDDEQCHKILQGCEPHCGEHTKLVLIEDVLTGEFAPKAAIMHGLRLSVYCRGGRQRTTKELLALFARIRCKQELVVPLDGIHTMLVMQRQ